MASLLLSYQDTIVSIFNEFRVKPKCADYKETYSIRHYCFRVCVAIIGENNAS